MQNKEEKQYMLAEEYTEQGFWPDSVEQSLDDMFNSLEYGDVYEGDYQVWEYPSGKVYEITPDRNVADKYYYSPPSDDLWEPVLTEIGVDKQRVAEAYKKLTSRPKKLSFIQRFKRRLGIG